MQYTQRFFVETRENTSELYMCILEMLQKLYHILLRNVTCVFIGAYDVI
jgi:hypothetical protein